MGETKAVTVGELIAHLQTFDPTLPVCYRFCSDWAELELSEVGVEQLQMARGDGYVGSGRPDKPTIPWLTFPGN